MIFNVSAKSLTLLFAAGVASTTTASNLRQRRAALFKHHGQQVRNPSASAVSVDTNSIGSSGDEEVTAAASTAFEPSIALDKSIYAESESITATFSVGPPSHPYYSSVDAPSLNLDYNYPQWSIGLFMRDADPQGGTLSPIVSVNVCGALGEECDADDRNFASYNELSVTFGNEHLDLMDGQWPLEISRYGTGFDAYVLDGRGAAAIGPLEFYIRDEDEEEADTRSNAASNPLLKFHKGTKKSTERQHVSSASKVAANAAEANVKIANANGLEMSSNAVPSEPSVHETAKAKATAAAPSKSSIASEKKEYEDDEPVLINFSLPATDDFSNYKIGIFMRMANPQGGSLEPVVSLPLCSDERQCNAIDSLMNGSVTFSQETMKYMMPSGKAQWPIDLYQWGTGFDAYVLDASGDDLVGPAKFNILMNDTY